MNSCTTRINYIAVRPDVNQYDQNYHSENAPGYVHQALEHYDGWLNFYIHQTTIQEAPIQQYAGNNRLNLDKTSILFFDSIYYFSSLDLENLH